MVYHTFWGKFQPTFSISGPRDGFKKRDAFFDKKESTACKIWLQILPSSHSSRETYRYLLIGAGPGTQERT